MSLIPVPTLEAQTQLTIQYLLCLTLAVQTACNALAVQQL